MEKPYGVTSDPVSESSENYIRLLTGGINGYIMGIN